MVEGDDPAITEIGMRTHPPLETKTIEQMQLGDLVIDTLGDGPSYAIFTVLPESRDGEKLPAFVYLPNSASKLPGPCYCIVDSGPHLCLGQEYVLVIDPLSRAPNDHPSRAQLVISKSERLLRVWNLEGRSPIALNVDTGASQRMTNDYNMVQCGAWEIRSKVDGKVDWSRNPLFQWRAHS